MYLYYIVLLIVISEKMCIATENSSTDTILSFPSNDECNKNHSSLCGG